MARNLILSQAMTRSYLRGVSAASRIPGKEGSNKLGSKIVQQYHIAFVSHNVTTYDVTVDRPHRAAYHCSGPALKKCGQAAGLTKGPQ